MNALPYASSLAGTSLRRYIIQETSRPPGTACYNIPPLEKSLNYVTAPIRIPFATGPIFRITQIAAILEISQTARESGFDLA